VVAVSYDHETVQDCFGRFVRITDERLAHILEHEEMAEMKDELERILQDPAEVRVSRSDENARLFYEYYAQTQIGGKWLCIG
jgi:hypothetical protein